MAVLGLLVMAATAGAQTTDLTEREVLTRLVPDSVAAKRLAIDLAREPITWPGEADRRLRAAALRAHAQLAAAQSTVDAFERVLVRVREIAAALGRGEDAGDNAGFDRVDAERERAIFESQLADAREARSRAQAALAGFIGVISEPGALRARVGVDPTRRALPPVATLVEQALRLVKDDPPAPVTVPTRNRKAPEAGAVPPAAPSAIAEARRVEIRIAVSTLAAIVVDRRSSVDQFRRDGVGNAETLVRIGEVSYENGIRSVQDVLAAHRALAVARVRIAELALAARRAEIDLEELTGETLP